MSMPSRLSVTLLPATLGVLSVGLASEIAALAFGLGARVADGGQVVLMVLAPCALVVVLWAAISLVRRRDLGARMQTVQGRTELFSGALCLQVIAMIAGCLLSVVAPGLLGLGVLVQALLSVEALRTIRRPAPPEAAIPAAIRVASVLPLWQLLLSGWCVIGLAAAALGLMLPALVLFWAGLVLSCAIWLVAIQRLDRPVPPELRPLALLHLAPAGVLGVIAEGFGGAAVTLVLGLITLIGAGVALVRLRWLLAAGGGPLWAVLGFPLAAMAALWLTLPPYGRGKVWLWCGLLALVLAALVTVWGTARLIRAGLKSA